MELYGEKLLKELEEISRYLKEAGRIVEEATKADCFYEALVLFEHARELIRQQDKIIKRYIRSAHSAAQREERTRYLIEKRR